MTRLLLAAVALTYAVPAHAFPLVAAAVASAPASLGLYVAAFLGGYTANVTTGHRERLTHERTCPARAAHTPGQEE